MVVLLFAMQIDGFGTIKRFNPTSDSEAANTVIAFGTLHSAVLIDSTFTSIIQDISTSSSGLF